MSRAQAGGSAEQLPKRAADALTSFMTVLEDLPAVAGDSERFAVVSDSGTEYLVDRRSETCTCPDMLHRKPSGGCRHLQRVRFATGIAVIPEWVDRSAIDPQLGEHVSASPRIRTDDGSVEVFKQ